MRGVVLRQPGADLGVVEGDGGDDLQVVSPAPLVMGTQDVAVDAAMAIDGNLDRHACPRESLESTAFTVSTTFPVVKPK